MYRIAIVKFSNGHLWIVLFVAIVSVMVLARASRADLSKQQQEKIRNSVALVLVHPTTQGYESWGSGLVVRYPNGTSDCIYILTDAHVVKAGEKYCNQAASDASQIKIQLNPKWYRSILPVSRVILYSPYEKDDLALLEVKKSNFGNLLNKIPPSFSIYRDAPLSQNSTITYFGFPTKEGAKPHSSRLNSVHVSSGKIQTLEFVRKYSAAPPLPCANAYHPDHYFWFAPGVWRGGSGGGVFDDKGNWIGVADVAVPFNKGTLKGKVATGVTKTSIIAQFLRQKPQGKTTSSLSAKIKEVYVGNVTTSISALNPSVVKHGNIHIVYSDGRNVQVTNDGNCSKPKISPDHLTVGWCHGQFQEYRNIKNILKGTGPTTTLYYWETSIVFYKNHHVVSVFGPFQDRSIMGVWDYQGTGQKAALHRYGMHGPPLDQLWDITSNKIIAVWEGWQDIKKAPSWVKSLSPDPNY